MWRMVYRELRAVTNDSAMDLNPMELNEVNHNQHLHPNPNPNPNPMPYPYPKPNANGTYLGIQACLECRHAFTKR
jgi:hypothetical protein